MVTRRYQTPPNTAPSHCKIVLGSNHQVTMTPKEIADSRVEDRFSGASALGHDNYIMCPKCIHKVELMTPLYSLQYNNLKQKEQQEQQQHQH